MDQYKTCNLCQKRVKNLKPHLKNHSIRKYECLTCNSKFKTKNHLESQSLIHKAEKPFKCEICGIYVKRKLYLTEHIKRHKEERHKCGICDMTYASSQGLKIHQAKEHNMTFPGTSIKQYKCDLCEKIFYCKSSWKTHLLGHTTEKQFECQICHETFRRKSSLTRHMERHGGDETKKFDCGLCTRKFRTNTEMENHLLTHLKEKPYKCRFCLKSFTQPSCLRSHEKIHNVNGNQKTHKCLTCGAKFSLRNYLQRHMRTTHSNSRNFKCEVCHKGFKSGDNLTRHKNEVHNYTKCRFWCVFCVRKFHSKVRLSTHLFSHIREKPFACKFCYASFSQSSSRTCHIRNMHGRK